MPNESTYRDSNCKPDEILQNADYIHNSSTPAHCCDNDKCECHHPLRLWAIKYEVLGVPKFTGVAIVQAKDLCNAELVFIQNSKFNGMREYLKITCIDELYPNPEPLILQEDSAAILDKRILKTYPFLLRSEYYEKSQELNDTIIQNVQDYIGDIRPHIDSTTGNWFIGDQDTGVHAQGDKGEDGNDGADGFSPSVSVSKSGNTTTISVTDEQGTTSSTITDGSNGESAYEIWLEQGHTGTEEDFFDWLRGDKVTKFYNSIEELEIGEIGEYQGETNATFTHGYFYERGTGTTEIKVISENTVSPTYYVDVHPLNDKSKSVRLVNNINISNPLYHGGISAQYKMSNGDKVEIFGFPSDNPYIKTTQLMPAIPPVSTSPWYAMPKAYNYTQNEWVDYEIEISGSGNWDWSVTIEGQNPSSFLGWGFEAYIYMMYYPYPEIGYVPCLIVGRFNGNYICPMPIDLPFTMQIDDLWFDNSIFLGDQLRLYNLINDSFTFKTFQYISSPSIQRIDVQPRDDTSHFVTDSEIGWIEH